MEASPDLVEFCSRERAGLVRALTLYCGRRDVAEELAHEALARVCLHWRKVRALHSPEAWTYRVAINLANSFFRRRVAERKAATRSGTASRIEEPDQALAIAVRAAVAGLPRRQRAVLILRFFADLPVTEVAQLMGCPEGTVKSLTRRAVASLRSEMGVSELEEASNAV